MGEGSEKHCVGGKVNKVWNQRGLVILMWAFYRKPPGVGILELGLKDG